MEPPRQNFPGRSYVTPFPSASTKNPERSFHRFSVDVGSVCLCDSIIFCQRRDHNSSPPNLPDTFFDVIVNVKRDSSTTRWPLGRISRWLLLGWHFKQLSLQDGWAASQECPLWSFSFWPFQKSVPESLLDSLCLMIQLERCGCLFWFLLLQLLGSATVLVCTSADHMEMALNCSKFIIWQPFAADWWIHSV